MSSEWEEKHNEEEDNEEEDNEEEVVKKERIRKIGGQIAHFAGIAEANDLQCRHAKMSIMRLEVCDMRQTEMRPSS